MVNSRKRKEPKLEAERQKNMEKHPKRPPITAERPAADCDPAAAAEMDGMDRRYP